jgi:glycosyltransferase involved in cell wall biosynthesis
MNRPKTLLFIGAYDGCAMWRGIQPIQTLNAKGYPCAWRQRDSEDSNRQTNAADIVILERIYWLPNDTARGDRERYLRALRTVNNKRRIVVFETDDDLITDESVKHTRLFHTEWSDADAEAHRNETIATIKMCDAITTTNDVLANLMREQLEMPVWVLPNAIPWESWRNTWRTRKRSIDKLTIGWAGGWRVKDDLRTMVEAWKIIAEQYPQVHFVIAGTVHPDYKQFLPEDRITYRDWVSVHNYPMQYADFDITCCSLADLPFNYKKSPCKAFEAAAAESVVVASPVVYDDYMRHGKDGLIAETVDEWVLALSALIENEKYRKTLARRWSERVYQRHNLDRNCWQWARAWSEIMEMYSKRDTPRMLAAV